MVYEHPLHKCLVTNKDDYSFDEFNDKFYRKLRMDRLKYEQDQYYIILRNLYNMDTESYMSWFNKFKDIPYSFVKNNTELVEKLVEDNKVDLMKIAYEMNKKKNALISRTIPTKATVTTVNESSQVLLFTFKELLKEISENKENNSVTKAQQEFERVYSEYKNDIYLRDLYVKILADFEQEILSRINSEINKVNSYSKVISEYGADSR